MSSTVTQATEPAPSRRILGLLMFAVLLLSYAMNAMDRQVFPLLLTDVRREYGFEIADAGLLATIFTGGMAVAGIPTGFLLARLSRKVVLMVGVLLFSAGTAATVTAYGFKDMLFYRAATGLGEAMQITVLISIAASYFRRYSSAAVGTLSFTYGIGAIIGPILAGRLLAAFQSWRAPMLIYGLLGVAAVLLIAVFVRSWFSEARASGLAASTGAPDRLWNHNIVVLTVVSILWGLALQSYFGLYPTYLREGLHYSATDAGSLMSFFGVGGLTSIAGGWLGDRFTVKQVMAPSFLLAAVLAWLPFHGVTSYYLLAIVSFFYGVIGGGILFVNVAGYHVRAVSPRLASVAAGLFVTTFYAAGALAGYVMGALVHAYGWQHASEFQWVALPLLACVAVFAIRSSTMSARTRPGVIGAASASDPSVAVTDVAGAIH